MASSSHQRHITFKYTKKSLKLISLLHKLGVIHSFIIISNSQKIVKVSPFEYRQTPFFKSVRLVSTPSRSYTIKISSLKILEKSIGQGIIILETTQGLITHRDALRLNVSGRILCVIF